MDRAIVAIAPCGYARADWTITVTFGNDSVAHEVSGDAGAAAGFAITKACGYSKSIIVGSGEVMKLVPVEFGGQA